MRQLKNEIAIAIFLIFFTLSAFFYFYNQIEEKKEMTSFDLYTLIPNDPQRIISINKPSIVSDSILFLFPQSLSQDSFFLTVIQTLSDVSPIVCSFHPSGTLFYIKISPTQRKKAEKRLFGTFLPQHIKQKGTDFSFYSDTSNRFFSSFYYKGIWVLSGSKKLLENAALQKQKGAYSFSKEIETALRSFESNVPINIGFPVEEMHLILTENDSIVWQPHNNWLTTDIFNSEGKICYFGSLLAPQDSFLKQAISDSLSLRLTQLFPSREVMSQIEQADDKILYTTCFSFGENHK